MEHVMVMSSQLVTNVSEARTRDPVPINIDEKNSAVKSLWSRKRQRFIISSFAIVGILLKKSIKRVEEIAGRRALKVLPSWLTIVLTRLKSTFSMALPGAVNQHPHNIL
jgi:hypothetical protein